MKWYFYIFIVFTVACSGKITITEDKIKPDVFYADNRYNPFSGKCLVVYSDTNLVKEQFNYKHGMLHGEAIAWYKNGQLRRRGSYLKGQISGKWEFWDEKGNMTLEAYYGDDMLNGTYISKYRNGKIREKGQYAANRRTGKWQYYNEAGQLLPSGQY
jgi:antitoxin component YwqK of YwqJK toxin-antitoxin module